MKLSEKGDCTPHRMDDEFLIKFLRARFWKVDNSYKLVSWEFLSNTRIVLTHWKFQMCRYYDFKEANPDYFVNVHPGSLQSMGEHNIIQVLPYRDQNGRRIMIHKIGNWKPNKVPLEDIFRATLILMEIGSMEPRTQILGGVGIFDLENLGLNHCWHMSPSLAQKIIAIMVVSVEKLSQISFINTFDFS